MPSGCILRCLSVDIIFDYDKGDLCKPQTQQAWIHFAESGQIDGALMGPPCHTFSAARELGGVAGYSEGDGGPRVIRTREEIFGLPQMTPQEADYIQVSNELLCFSLHLLLVIMRHLKGTTSRGVASLNLEDTGGQSLGKAPENDSCDYLAGAFRGSSPKTDDAHAYG